MTEVLVDVAVPYPLPGSLHYSAPSEMAAQIQLGSVIQVPFRSGSTHAFVLGFPEETDVPRAKLKSALEIVLAEPIFDEQMLKFLRWVADYYCSPLGEVVATAMPKHYWQSSRRKTKKSKTTDNDSLSLLNSEHAPSEKPQLTEEQSAALTEILRDDDLRPVLLHGVTGSGKTEVYMHVLEKVLAEGQSAIILVPEIALTPQLLGRFSGRFPGKVAVLHSDLSPRERHEQWDRLKTGQANVVIGARSAVFAPLRNLGLIIIDEEHEGSFKQEDHVRYHARDIGVVRAHFSKARIVLGSATPSVESYANAERGKFKYVQLKHRVQNRAMPQIRFVDLKDKDQWLSPDRPWISRVLVDKLRQTLASGNQSMLYLNRLGFAHFLFCPDCGHTWRCRNCDVALTYYQNPPQLKCHYCGANKIPPHLCEECQGTKVQTMGMGTEQLEKEIKEMIPKARVARLDRSIVKTRHDLESILNSIARRDVDIVIGTQMIAKGHDFPGIALVGILVADASLNLPDFRANEKTFQIITQVSGRAGRAEQSGEVVIQSLNPEHPVLTAASQNQSQDFYRMEMATRRQFGFPPFQRMAMFRFQHRNPQRVEGFSHEMALVLSREIARRKYSCQVVGPAEAPLSKLKGLYRWQCLLKGESVKDLQSLLKGAIDYAAKRKNPVQMHVDVDPMSAL